MTTVTDQARTSSEADILAITTIRTLAMDAVQAANSGHPGTPMGLAPVVYTLWQRYLQFDPQDPIWPNRDRFVLSAGHASTLLYALLHLARVRAVNPAYETLGEPTVSLDDLKRFRQLDSKCPGHPEYRWTSGVECTTGPLGTGAATSVGMAIAAHWQAAYFNRPGFQLFDYDTFALCGDGDLMEGVAAEAASLAGHLHLANLCWIYDNNHITIEGRTSLAFTEDVATRFIVYSHIGYGSSKQGTSEAHGEPLGEDEVRATKRFYGWPEDEVFRVPEEVYATFEDGIGQRGRAARDEWMALFERYRSEKPERADELYRMQHRQLPEGWDADIPDFPPDAKGKATRDTSGTVLNAVANRVPWLIGGSADLSPSTKTRLVFEGAGDFEAGYGAPGEPARNLHFGVREFASAAVANGLALCKIRPFWSTFLIFSDFARGAIRLSALMEIPVIHLFTHDSIGVGEDGPTHQPVEQLPSLRLIPGLRVFRPADANEVAQTWRTIMPFRHEPVAIVLTRQALPTLDRSVYASAAGVA